MINAFSSTPGFSLVTLAASTTNRFNGFSRLVKLLKWLACGCCLDHPAEAGCY